MFVACIKDFVLLLCCPLGAECELGVQKTFRNRPGRLLNVLYTFRSCPASRGISKADLGSPTHLEWDLLC